MNAIEAIKQFFLIAGATWVVYLLGALSALSVAIAIERWLVYRQRGGDIRALAVRLDDHLGSGSYSEAVLELEQAGSSAARIAAAGLRLAHLGPASADKAMKSASALERGRLEKRLAFLGTLGNNAPFVGLFGTVIGIIQAFAVLGEGGGGGHNEQLMAAIAEALVTTAVGIGVALPAVACYNYFQRRMAAIIGSSEVLTNIVLAYLSAAPRGGP